MSRVFIYMKLYIPVALITALLSACTPPRPPVVDQTKPPSQDHALGMPAPVDTPQLRESVAAKPRPHDEELFWQGFHQITDQTAKQDHYALARRTMEALRTSYPQSTWSDAARIVLQLLATMDVYQDQVSSEQTMTRRLSNDRTKYLADNEQLKKNIKMLQDKYQTDLTTLQQENDQLKKDIQLLKNLDLQLDKRDKQLR